MPGEAQYPSWLEGEWSASLQFAGYELPAKDLISRDALFAEADVPGFKKCSIAGMYFTDDGNVLGHNVPNANRPRGFLEPCWSLPGTFLEPSSSVLWISELKALSFLRTCPGFFSFATQLKSALEAASSHLPLLLASLPSLEANHLDDEAKRVLTEAAKTRGATLKI